MDRQNDRFDGRGKGRGKGDRFESGRDGRKSFDRPRRDGRPSRDGQGDRGYRYDKPRYDRDGQGDRSYSKPRFDGDGQGDRGPRYDKPRYDRDGQGDRSYSKSRYDRGGQGDRGSRYEKPRYDRDGQGDRSYSKSRYDRGGQGDRGPRYDKPRYDRDGQGDRSYGKPRFDRAARDGQEYSRDTKLAVSADVDQNDFREDRLEGRNPVREALKSGRNIEKAWVQKSSTGFERGLYELVKAIREQGGVIVELERSKLDAMSETYNHQGIIAQTAMHNYVSVDDLLKIAEDRGEPPFLFVLDRIQDAYNLGSILRIADACGAHGVIFPQRRAIGLNALVAKASAGAIEHVRCARVTNLAQTIMELKEKGLWVAGTAAEGEAVFGRCDMTGPIAVVIGSEGEGLSQTVRKQCDFLVSIPMNGQVNSLNAAVACGIVAFEVRRQRDLAGQTSSDKEKVEGTVSTEVTTAGSVLADAATAEPAPADTATAEPAPADAAIIDPVSPEGSIKEGSTTTPDAET